MEEEKNNKMRQNVILSISVKVTTLKITGYTLVSSFLTIRDLYSFLEKDTLSILLHNGVKDLLRKLLCCSHAV